VEPSGVPQYAASILVVDDTLPNLELLSEMLKARGYRVRPVPSGDLALQAAKSNPPDLILLDIHMPEMDGYEVCERLKADEKLQEIPVLFISGLSEITDKVKAFGVGGADYITKPFQFEEVEARVATHLELRRQRRQLVESNEQLQKLEGLREDMTAMLVHDLKNPLVTSSMALQAVLRRQQPVSCLTPEERGFLEMARDSQARLAGMIDDMLQIARAEGGQMPLERTELDLCEIVEAAVQEVEPQAQRSQLRIVRECPVARSRWAQEWMDRTRGCRSRTRGRA
jgi:two-component system sensor histidine kinase/response regulator